MNTTATRSFVRAGTYRMLSECYKEPCLEFAQDVAGGYLYKELAGNLNLLGITISLEGLKILASKQGRGDASPVQRREGEVLTGIRGGGGWSIPSDSDRATDILLSLKEVYYPLFVGPSPSLALPVESVYKEWAQNKTSVISTDVRGMLMGDPAVDMITRYKEAGIEIPREYKDVPDHLALLLEYMALLCEAAEGDQRAESADGLCQRPPEEHRGSVGRGLHSPLPMEGDGHSPITEAQGKFLQDHLDWLDEMYKLIYVYTEDQSDLIASQFYRTVADATTAYIDYERGICLKREKI